MSAVVHERRPLVLAATRAAVEQAARLGFRGVLENEVERAIVAGRIVREPRIGSTKAVFIDGGFRVEVRRVRARPSERLAWAPVRVERVTR